MRDCILLRKGLGEQSYIEANLPTEGLLEKSRVGSDEQIHSADRRAIYSCLYPMIDSGGFRHSQFPLDDHYSCTT